uniref:Uncharacterized protein n=1 Tax=Arundo donax TaxID=35708 RepID=A0A0A8YJJ8_ARUDO
MIVRPFINWCITYIAGPGFVDFLTDYHAYSE